VHFETVKTLQGMNLCLDLLTNAMGNTDISDIDSVELTMIVDQLAKISVSADNLRIHISFKRNHRPSKGKYESF
jgi:hypothetical protein